MPDELSCEISGIKFKNPLILASGILGVAPSSIVRLANAGIGGATTKSIGPKTRLGYNNPSIIEIDDGTFLNSVGLANPGMDAFIPEIREIKKNTSIPLIVSVFGDSPEEYAEMAKKAESAGADAIEINVSCPHAEVASIGLSPELTKKFTMYVKKAVNIPVFVKLTPNVTNIIPIAQAAEKGGADAIVAINTVRGLSLSIQTGRPILSHGIGGLSGKAIRPIGVRCIYEIYPNVKIPVIGCGGISKWQDVLEYIYAGATAVQIGSIFSRGDDKINEILEGLHSFLKKNNISNLQELKGKSHTFDKELEATPKSLN
ncbi:MAG: dihydroorotate dehydrogenase [Promethearchaeota archaeon]